MGLAAVKELAADAIVIRYVSWKFIDARSFCKGWTVLSALDMLDVGTAVVRCRNQPRSFALALIFPFHKTYMMGFYSL
jgi:hypothetical protein